MSLLCVNNLGKAYRSYPSRWSRLFEWLFPFAGLQYEMTWILEDINFEINSGESVGIVGVNGAGKSTLLKVITGTTQPTTGTVQVSGRVAAMLELGMGFHPDFTGRQNVYMSGQLLGYGTREIADLMPEIEAFAEIGDYIDRPVRVYSSGMQMRLAFSVATMKRPEFLIIDEALSVGDDYFQHKSFERIRQFRKEGTTLLFVSHDKGAIQSICDRVLFLDAGRLVMNGSPEAVLDYYNAMLADRNNQKIQQNLLDDGTIETISGSGEASIANVSILDHEGKELEVLDVGTTVFLKIKVVINEYIPRLVVGYIIKNRLGQYIYGTNTQHTENVVFDLMPGETLTFTFTFLANLGPGSYSISVALHSDETHLSNNYEWRDLALVFRVENLSRESFIGTAWLPATTGVER